ncbi:MAG: hypothetical protein SGILL_002250 [Bacillariaceae sp.]
MGVGSGGGLYLVTIYVVILVIMILRYAPRSYLMGWDTPFLNDEEEEEKEEEESGEEQSTTNEEDDQKGLQSGDSLINMASQKEIDGSDTEEEEAMDRVPSMRNASSQGALLESLEHPPRPKPTRQKSSRMLKSRSTGSLQKSLRAQVPTFGE